MCIVLNWGILLRMETMVKYGDSEIVHSLVGVDSVLAALWTLFLILSKFVQSTCFSYIVYHIIISSLFLIPTIQVWRRKYSSVGKMDGKESVGYQRNELSVRHRLWKWSAALRIGMYYLHMISAHRVILCYSCNIHLVL